MPDPFLDPGEEAGAEIAGMLETHIATITEKIDRITRAIDERRTTAGDNAQALQYLLANRKQLQDAVSGRITRDIGGYVQRRLAALTGLSTDALAAAGVDAGLSPSDVSAALAARQNITVWFETASREAAKHVFSSLLSYVNTGSRIGLQRMVGEMGQEKYAKYGATIVHSHLNGYFQETNNRRAIAAGVRRFRYDGPAPQRDFCVALYRKTFTAEEIAAMDNGQTSNVMVTCGGYNCPHRWTPIAPTKADRERTIQTPAEAAARVNKIAAGNGTLGNAGRGKVFIKGPNGAYTNKIGRSIKNDPETGWPFYTRFDGTKQYLKQDQAGNYFIDAYGPGNKAPKGPRGPGGRGPRPAPGPRRPRPPAASPAIAPKAPHVAPRPPAPPPPKVTPAPKAPPAKPAPAQKAPAKVTPRPHPAGLTVKWNPNLETDANGNIYGYHIPAKGYTYKGAKSAKELISAHRPASGIWKEDDVKSMISGSVETDQDEIDRRYALAMRPKPYGERFPRDPSRGPPPPLGPPNPREAEIRARVEKASKRHLSMMTPERFQAWYEKNGEIPIFFESGTGAAGTYSTRFHAIQIDTDAFGQDMDGGERTVMHEMVHSVQDKSSLKTRAEISLEFRRRTGGEPAKTFYYRDQYGRPVPVYIYTDKFIEKYAGRTYDTVHKERIGEELLSSHSESIMAAMQGNTRSMEFLMTSADDEPTMEMLYRIFYQD